MAEIKKTVSTSPVYHRNTVAELFYQTFLRNDVNLFSLPKLKANFRWFPCGLIMHCIGISSKIVSPMNDFLGHSRYQEQHWCWMRSSIMFNLSNGKLR
jgi:hypothetical protein